MSRYSKIFICFLSILLVTGCFNFKDIDKRFFVTVIGVDIIEETVNNGEPTFKISLKAAIPAKEIEYGGSNFEVFQTEAKSISEGIRLLKANSNLELDFGHAKAIVFGKTLVEHANMADVMDFFLRRRDQQNIAWMSLGEPSAEAALLHKNNWERLPGNQLLLSFGEIGTESVYINSIMQFDFYRRFFERGLDPFLPITKIENDQSVINQLAIFNKEKAKLILTPSETKLFNMVANEFQKTHASGFVDGKRFDLFINDVTTEYGVKEENGKVILTVTFDAKGILEEFAVPLKENIKFESFEEAAAKEIKEKIEHLVGKLQEHQVDPIGFGLYYRAHFDNSDEAWKNWLEQYPDASCHVETSVKVKASGVIK